MFSHFVLFSACCNAMQDVFKLLTGFGIKLDEVQEAYKISNNSNLAASVEQMKTRRGAQVLTKALRDFNPKLAQALIDDRDEVTQSLQLLILRHTLTFPAVCCALSTWQSGRFLL